MIRTIRLLPAEWALLAYIFITLAFQIVSGAVAEQIIPFYSVRTGAVLIIGLLAYLSGSTRKPMLHLIRNLFPFALLGFWYAETYYLSGVIFSNQDALLFQADEWIFGGQPSLWFSNHFPHPVFSELMYFGYFSYFFLVMLVPLWCWFRSREHLDSSVFVLLSSFLMYYLFFIICPASGPQFYFQGAAAQVPEGYFFSDLMRVVIKHAENPTGAFPSSHVGISTLVLILCFRTAKRLLWVVIPIYVLLVCATIYIKAHYVVDVIGGLISGVVLFAFTRFLYRNLFRR